MSKRLHLFEFEDQPWLPHSLRQATTEFLATTSRLTQIWKPTAEVINQLLKDFSQNHIVVLGAGSGGGILDILPFISPEISVTLTDLFPNKEFTHSDSRLTYVKHPVNATSVPDTLKGLRVMYAAFHHLPPEVAKSVLKNAMDTQQPIAIFEGTERSAKGLVAVLFIPLMVLILTPFVRPWRWSRIFLTYVFPVLPFLIFWDGLVSALRTYNLEEMKDLTSELSDFSWQIEILKGPHGENLPSFIGRPQK